VGGAAAWPLAARAQPSERVRRIGILITGAADDPESFGRAKAFVQALQQLGWTEGRNLQVEYRWGASAARVSGLDPDRVRTSAGELVASAPEVILAGGTLALAALQQATRSVPIVFANVTEPVGAGFVGSLAKPGGNATGFMSVEYSFSGKLLELLKQIAPRVTRAAVVRTRAGALGIGQFAAIQAVAPSLGLELTPVNDDVGEMERAVTAFVRGSNDGLIVTGQMNQIQRDRIIGLAARYRLPAVYPYRRFATDGGLISYGVDQADLYRRAAGYVDRILKGEKPGDLPVQAPTKYEMVINLKAARTLGVEVPATVRARANEVIE
jgi:putative ABC transport system substrate-binding protein